MRTITRTNSSTKHFMNDVHHVERSGIHGRSRSYAHKTDAHELENLPRSVDAVSAQISMLLNRIRSESSR